MLLDNKHNCIGDLSAQTRAGGNWRRKLTAKYNDSRNEKAADVLARLAGEFKDMTDSQWAALEPYWASDIWPEAVSEVCRHVGFKYVDSLNSFITQLVSVLSQLAAAA